MASLAFDATFYLSQNPDVATAIARGQFASAEDHYNKFGAFEGRNPNAYFDSAFYLAQNPDVLNARANPFQHFLQFGAAEGRFENNTADAALDTNNNNRADEFNSAAYLAANSDVATAITNGTLKSAYQHYVLFGQFEGRPGVTVGPFTNTGVAPGTGSNLALTSNIDTLPGTTGNDTFVAGVTGAGDATLNAGDSINGGSGTDQIQLFGNTNAGNFAGANVTNVEQVYAQFSATSGTLDVSGNAGVQQAWISKGTIGADGATVTLTKAQTAGVTGTVAGAGVATFAFTETAGAADTASLALNGAAVTKGVTVAGIETLNIAATGTNTIGTLTASSASTVNITGAGSLTAVLSDNAAYKTIDASAATGNIVIDASAANAANQVLSIKTGSGADNYTSLFANLTNADKIDLGAGNDTLSFADATDLSTSANAAKLSGVANVEALRVTGTSLAFKVDGDLITQSKFVHDSTGAFTGTNFASTDSLVVEDSAAAASTVAMKLGQSAFNLGLEGSKTAISDASAGITVTGASTVNVSSSGFAEQGANKVGLTTDGNGTINITGAKDLVVTAAVNTGSTGLSIDGSSFTGKLDISGSANGDIIKGGAGADTIRAFGGGVDTLTGGAGADKFVVFGADADTAANAIAVTDIITDFVSGTDALSGFTAAGSATNFAKATAVSAALSDFITAADTALNGTVKYYVGQVGSDAYVAYDDNGTGFTSLVKLTGVSLAGVAQGDIVAA